MSDIRYSIRHLTAYRYTGRIDLCHSLARLVPRDCEGQKTLESEVIVSPTPRIQSDRKDYFGNERKFFSIQNSHDSLEVIASSIVEKSGALISLPDSRETWDSKSEKINPAIRDKEGIPLGNYLLPSRACPVLPETGLFLQPSLQAGREKMEVVNELMSRVFSEFSYVPGATDTTTPLTSVFEGKRGVCQDFAHVMIAALRQIEIPARYVSGYLETLPPPGQEKLQGSDATHAWIEAYSTETGWVGFDPTNDIIPGCQHIKIAHGRDYFDVQPLKGTFIGNGTQNLEVEVDVERVMKPAEKPTP